MYKGDANESRSVGEKGVLAELSLNPDVVRRSITPRLSPKAVMPMVNLEVINKRSNINEALSIDYPALLFM